MNLRPAEIVDIAFQLIAFLFAISIHESAHAWMANRCGDPTARMLGRVSLNPIRHISPVGTVLVPLGLALANSHLPAGTRLPIVGWAKPTPVDPRNFRSPVKDDILTSVAGPISNFAVAGAAVITMLMIALISPHAHQLVQSIPGAYQTGVPAEDSTSMLVPVTTFLYQVILVNVMLAVFNLIPIPPLDGSHVLRHFLSDSVRSAYDNIGLLALFALMFLGGGLLSRVLAPFQSFFDWMLTSL